MCVIVRALYETQIFSPLGAQVGGVGETLELSTVYNWQTLTHLHDEMRCVIYLRNMLIISNF